jgi:uncharacterized protein (DUF2336 family)
MNYETAKQMSSSVNVVERRAVAQNSGTAPEILYFLTDDIDDSVRHCVAENTATPRQADLKLTGDHDEAVRLALAAKIAALIPALPEKDLDKVQALTLETLRKLAQDQALRVRAVLSEALQHLPNAPKDVIARLARDVELRVAEPVLRHSPLLTDEDLLEIIRSNPVLGAIPAIAGRKSMSESVSEAIAASEDVAGIAALLANPSARIREDTLDKLLDRAPQQPLWHEPLVRRPRLPLAAIKRLAEFVSAQLLEVLKTQPSVDDKTAGDIAELVRTRMTETEEERPADRAQRLFDEGTLDEAVITAALEAGERGFVSTALGLLSGADSTAVSRILSSGSSKGVTALVWKAGLSMRLALQVQTRLAGISPKQALYPRGGTDYPLSEGDLRWQLEFFGVAV